MVQKKEEKKESKNFLYLDFSKLEDNRVQEILKLSFFPDNFSPMSGDH